MTRFYLIRHGMTDAVGKTLVGRTPGVHLNEEGRKQAERLPSVLAAADIQHIISSPMERAQETAAPLAGKLGLPIQTAPELTELDFGDWTNRDIPEMHQDRQWQRFNSFRSATRIPNGELMAEVQTRMVKKIDRLNAEFPGQGLALFSHGDPLRTVLAYYLGMPLDFMQRLEVSPGSVSLLLLDAQTAKIEYINRLPW